MIRSICAVLALALAACTGNLRVENPEGVFTIGGFQYSAPGEGWTATLYPPSEAGLTYHAYKRDGDRWQFQLSEIAPVRPVRDQADVIAWAAQAGGGRAEQSDLTGAICARYAHRWRQTLSLGGPSQPWATIEERGLFCIDPVRSDRLVQIRVFERFDPDAQPSPDFERVAERLLVRVRARK